MALVGSVVTSTTLQVLSNILRAIQVSRQGQGRGAAGEQNMQQENVQQPVPVNAPHEKYREHRSKYRLSDNACMYKSEYSVRCAVQIAAQGEVLHRVNDKNNYWKFYLFTCTGN